MPLPAKEDGRVTPRVSYAPYPGLHPARWWKQTAVTHSLLRHTFQEVVDPALGPTQLPSPTSDLRQYTHEAEQ